ncbi:MAG: xanthine dehydrogenase family protein subunit M [bacterium]
MTFAYNRPPNIPEALALMTASPGTFPVLAGGTDLIVQWRSGIIKLDGVIDISELAQLRGISVTDEGVEIGALATHAEIAANGVVAQRFPSLATACLSIGGPQIQNRGTIGGNVMNASPAGDTLPVLLAHDADFLAQDLTGERWIPAREFFVGYRKTALKPQELLTRIRIRMPDTKERGSFLKVGARRAQAISKVSLCVRGRIRHGGVDWIKIAVGSVAPTPIRAPGTEALLTGKVITDSMIELARNSLADEVFPIDDIRSTADYRRFAAGGLLARYLREMTSRA